MTAKEYLSQARLLDDRINTKIQIRSNLRDLASKCNSTLSPTPVISSHDDSRLEKTLAKIIDLENEINAEIDRLVDLKTEIKKVLSQVSNPTQALILEKRYICNYGWETIASELFIDLRWIYRLHGKGLSEVQKIIEKMGLDH